jgi:3-oxoacyl-[acyl-carrier-protein] synthase II
MRRVVITGLGCVTPIGNNVDSFWQNLITGKSGIGHISSFNPEGFSSQVSGEVKNFDPSAYIPPKELRRMERFVQFAVYSSKMAWEDAGLKNNEIDSTKAGVLIGSGIGSLKLIEEQHKILLEKGPRRVSPFLIPLMIVDMASGQVAISLQIRGPNSCIATACASGTNAVGEAYLIIKGGYADIMVTGGAESCITPLGVAGFCSLKALSTRNDKPEKASRPFDKERDGFIMGEGAGILILEEMEHAKKRGAKIYAELIGYGMSGDAYHQTAPCPDGEGAYLAMKQAIEDAKINLKDIDYINAHGTSTILNDKMETIAIKRLFKDYAYKINISSIKSMTGHLLGAAGGVEAVATVLSINRKVIPPTTNYEFPDPDCDLDYVPNKAREYDVKIAMSNSFGFGGHNASLIFSSV